MISNTLRFVLLALAMASAGMIGWLGTACVAHVYGDHLLIDAVRTNGEAQIRQQAEQVRQFQQQQAAPAAAPAAVAPPVK